MVLSQYRAEWKYYGMVVIIDNPALAFATNNGDDDDADANVYGMHDIFYIRILGL